ncbi:MAG: SMP-30/gluconolactonase/LRE family protein [Elainellaceae cyanobacterium]
MSKTVRNVLTARARLGEGPIWDDHAGVLYWVDIYNHRVHQFNPQTGGDRIWDVGEVVGAIALTHGDRLIMVQRKQIAFLDLSTGHITPVTRLEEHLPDNRFNDGKCDAAGRFWFGSMCLEGKQGSLYRYDPDGSLHTMATGLGISNGLGWSPDHHVFYLTDSRIQTVFAYDFDLENGAIVNPRPLIDLSAEAFAPDGLTIDADGCIWSAMWDGWCVIRFDPTGKEMERIEMPVQRPTSCTFGGANYQQLYIASASVGLSEVEIQQSFYSGDLFCLDVSMRGMPANRFGSSVE